MRKFFVLVKKEIKELLTPQMLVPLLAMVLIFIFIGKVVGQETKKASVLQPIEVLDLDNSVVSGKVTEILGKSNLTVEVRRGAKVEEVIREAKMKNKIAVLVIPEGFGAGIENLTPQKIEAYSIMKNFSLMGSRNDAILRAALAAVNENLSREFLSKISSKTNPASIKQPLLVNDFVLIGGKQVNISPAAVAGFVSSQTFFIPIVLFMVIILASQLIATSIASEKENKTLETLLSSPVSRKAVVAAKLVGAGVVALASAVVYLFGMRYYITGLTGAGGASPDVAAKAAMSQLGLAFGPSDYTLLGISLFFGIMTALAIALILGSFAEDSKAAQGVITPLMILVLVPYFMTMFLDISSLSPGLKILVYAIPFSHVFMAAPNILLNHPREIWFGIFYLAALFIVLVFIAARIFSTDRIFTMRLNFRKKKIFPPET